MIPIEAKLIASGIGLVLLFVAFGVYRHSLIAEGEAKILASNTKQAAALQKQADQITAEWKGRADLAEHNHDAELSDLLAYRESHPLTGASELCKQSPGSPGHLPATAGGNRGHDGGSATPDLQSVPKGNPDVASNRVQMLELLGARADQISASRREWQQRELGMAARVDTAEVNP